MVRRRAPPTLEGWYALHDFRTIDWDAWRDAPKRVRDRAIDEGQSHLQKATAVADAADGDSAVYAMLGHEADLLIVHLRPTTTAIDRLQRRFEQTEFAGFTERTDSFVSVTEASGYSKKGREFIEGEVEDDSGLARYMRSRLEPEIPDAEHVSFYPMDKRRDPEYNWYDLPFEERAEHMDTHGVIGREYAGKVTQMITGAIGMDDWEWGVTLWADDLTDVKELLYEMRFDPSSSKYADFGPFWVGRRMEPADLAAYMAGETIAGDDEHSSADHSNVPATPEDAADGHGGGEHDAEEHGESAHSGGHPGGHPETDDSADGHPSGHETGEDGGHPGDAGEQSDEDGHPGGGGRPSVGDVSYSEVDDLPERLFQLGLRAGEDYKGGEYGLLFYSDADAAELAEEVDGLRGNFDHYDRHVATLVRASGGRSAVVSVWTAEDAAETAAGFLGDLPGITEQYGGVLDAGDAADGGKEDHGATTEAGTDEQAAASVRAELSEAGVYAGQPTARMSTPWWSTPRPHPTNSPTPSGDSGTTSPTPRATSGPRSTSPKWAK